jgi:putative transposase
MTRVLLINDELRERGQMNARWQVIDPKPRDGWIKLYDRESHQEQYKPLSEINEAVVDGRLVLCRNHAPRLSVASQSNTKLDQQLANALAHVRRVESLQTKYKISSAKAYDMARLEHASDSDRKKPFPSRATIYRYLEARRNGLPLLRGDGNKGNRNPRYDVQLTNLICQAADSLFLQQGSRWTLADLTTYINDQARQLGQLTDGREMTRQFVSKVVRNHLSVDPEIDRMDPKLVPAAKSIAKNRIVVARPFERVEQDALHLPFFAETEHGVTNNVWVVHAIDCCTAMPLGWRIVIGAPSLSDGLACVESIVFSKKHHFARLGIESHLDVFGTPSLLVFDNGPEARGPRMDNLVRLGIDPMHCKSRHAHGKPFIERLNRSLKDALQTLPGCTRLDGKDGRRAPADLGDKLMGIQELERWIVRWYYEEWANNGLKRHMVSDFHDVVRLGCTPAERWKTMTQDLAYAVPLSPPMSEWRMALYEHEARTLNRKTGITCRGFNYKGENLLYLVQKYGETPMKVLVNPDDYRQIYVDEGDGLPLVPLTEEFVDDTTPAYTFGYAREQLKEMASAQTESPAKVQFRSEVHARAIAATRKPTRKKQSKAEMNRAVAARAKEVQALTRAINNPVKISNGSIDTTSVPHFSFVDAPSLPVLNRATGEE